MAHDLEERVAELERSVVMLAAECAERQQRLEQQDVELGRLRMVLVGVGAVASTASPVAETLDLTRRNGSHVETASS